MRRTALLLLIAVFTFVIGVASNMTWKARHVSSWQYADTLCGISVIENPLCVYSSSLHEIPAVEFCSLVHNPQAYDRRIIRIRGTFFAEVGNSYNVYLQSSACDGYHERIGANYWNGDTISNLSNYLDAFAPTSRSAHVTVVGEFIDRTGHGFETMGGDRFLFIILHTEKISLAFPVPPNKRLQPTPR
jgi:hypothetical protein